MKGGNEEKSERRSSGSSLDAEGMEACFSFPASSCLLVPCFFSRQNLLMKEGEALLFPLQSMAVC